VAAAISWLLLGGVHRRVAPGLFAILLIVLVSIAAATRDAAF
jgi:hypothetical protein